MELCKTFNDIGIPDTESQQYAGCFETNGLSEVEIPELDKDTLRELKITKLDHQLTILPHAKIKSTKPKSPAFAAIKLPTVYPETTHPQFRKFFVDWDVYKMITSFPKAESTMK